MYKNYNMNQLVLPMPIDLEVMLEETDIAFVINDLVESVPDRAFVSFRVDPDVQKLLRQLFVQFHCQLVEVNIIDHEAIFINGTKIEANANKFTFVWKKIRKNYSEKLIENSNKMYDEPLKKEIISEIKRESPDELSVSELKEIDEKVKDFALMAVNLRKYTAKIQNNYHLNNKKLAGSKFSFCFRKFFLVRPVFILASFL